MELIVLKNYERLSEFVADEITKAIKFNSNLVLCMASGDTPKLTCDLLVKKLKDESVDYSNITFIGLDEWMGLPPANTGSCHYFFQKKLIEPLTLRRSQYFLFDGLSKDPEHECAKMDQVIAERRIDIMVVGIGINGHIGFNEPGTSFANQCHVAELAESTKQVGQKYFHEPVELNKGITVGLAHLMNAKTVFLIANGERKAEVIKKTIEGPVTESLPASIMQKHSHGFVVIDEEAGMLINQ